jgi:hypothetical protein
VCLGLGVRVRVVYRDGVQILPVKSKICGVSLFHVHLKFRVRFRFRVRVRVMVRGERLEFG